MASHTNHLQQIAEEDRVAFKHHGRVVDKRFDKTKLVVVDDSDGKEIIVHEQEVAVDPDHSPSCYDLVHTLHKQHELKASGKTGRSSEVVRVDEQTALEEHLDALRQKYNDTTSAK